jgi:hypothetical protein
VTRAALLVACLAAACAHRAAPAIHAIARGTLPDAVGEAPIAILELGDATIVLGDHRVTVVRGSAVAAIADAPLGWAGGTTIAAPDGEGRWAVGVAPDGTLWRITLEGELEPVADRLGLGDAHTRALAGAGTTTVASIAGGVASSIDGMHMDRVDRGTPVGFAAARGRLAIASATTVELWDLARGTSTSFAIAGVLQLAFAGATAETPRLVLATDQLVYAEDRGRLVRVAVPGPIRQLAAAGARVWIRTERAIYALAGTAATRVLLGDAHATRLFGSATGDAWAATDRGITRFALASAGDTDTDTAWHASVEPVFDRVCAHCHLPGGDAGIDLSTAASWAADRDELARRVLVTRTMPPAGTALSEDDRAALAAWLKP